MSFLDVLITQRIFFVVVLYVLSYEFVRKQDRDAEAKGSYTNGFTGSGNTLTAVIKGDLAGFKVKLKGAGLATDSNGMPNAGTVSSIEVIETATGQISTLTLYNSSTPAAQLVSEAAKGSGIPRADHYPDLMALLVPTFLNANGDGGGNYFQGSQGDDEINGKGGNDKLYLWKGDDKFDGGKGRDSVDASWQNKAINANLIKGWVKYGTEQASLSGVENVTGSRKDDTITGNSAANVLAGRKGNDKLTGKGGNDKFVFKPNEGTNVITDFQNGKDKLDLKGFKFKSKAAALKHFSEVGSSNDDICKFVFDGTIVKIKGVDLKNIDATDIVI